MSYFKSKPVRSKALRNSARGQQCSLRLPGCGGTETVVLCHMPYVGRGMGTKASDAMAFFGCHECHAQVDGRNPLRVSRRELAQALIRGHAETMQTWIDAGLVVVPDSK